MKLIADFHTHSLASGHSYATIEEMARIANKKKLKYLGITDHGPAIPGSADFLYFRTAHLAPAYLKNTQILFGSEANILNVSGKIDIDFETQERLDILLAGFHPFVGYKETSTKQNTKALINTIKKNQIDIISHIGNPQYTVNYKDIIKCLNDYNVVIEINNRSFLPPILSARGGSIKNCIQVMELCVKYNVSAVVSSDAHNQFQVGTFQLALEVIEKEKFPKKLIINNSKTKIEQFLKNRHPNKKPKEILY